MEPPSSTRTARCSCGALSITVRGEPFEVWVCHCLECQRQTGAPYSLTAGWLKEEVVATDGDARTWTRSSYRGRKIENTFCPACGSTLFNTSEAFPEAVMINAGNFGDAVLPPPTVEYWTEHRLPWVSIPTATVRWKRQAEDGEAG
ncbi:MAG: GFA family protein [Hyphomicrobiales bacterium]